ncbi:hypothetical protein CDAR_378881 [Caerostris darwini]|uniref:Uncharacterized protein n=1 Tax=Caerostris darwini TaxID=1538125 RepID=A0AAV4TW10_9ARAC|nr:hypothetical protein CDAR_378881 [Caerostris darwini]
MRAAKSSECWLIWIPIEIFCKRWFPPLFILSFSLGFVPFSRVSVDDHHPIRNLHCSQYRPPFCQRGRGRKNHNLSPWKEFIPITIPGDGESRHFQEKEAGPPEWPIIRTCVNVPDDGRAHKIRKTLPLIREGLGKRKDSGQVLALFHFNQRWGMGGMCKGFSYMRRGWQC